MRLIRQRSETLVCAELALARSPAGERWRVRPVRTAIASAVSLALGMASARAQEAPPPANQAGATTLKEIVVTAQYRKQTVQDIPYNISVVPGNSLGTGAVDDSSDLAKLVPGLLTVDSGPAARGNTNNFTLRGLRTDNPGGVDIPNQTISPVSTYFGETPVFIPLILRDLDHVEVLKGPQGTLYGSGSEAGTIRFIPNRPNFDKFTASATVGTGTTEGSSSSSPNSRLDGVLNVPLASNLAVRLAAGYEHLAGFIDDVGLAVRNAAGLPVPRVAADPTSGFVIAAPLRDANPSGQSYGKAALRWDPAHGIDLEATYLHQETVVHDCQCSNPNWPGGTETLANGYTGPVPPYQNASYTVPAAGPYKNTNLIQEPYDNLVDLGSLVASIDVGLATITSATSYYDSRTEGTMDSTYQWDIPGGVNYLPYYANYPRAAVAWQQHIEDKSWIQELRLVSNGTHTFDYVAGLYFQHEMGGVAASQYMLGLQQFYDEVGGGVESQNPQVGDLVYLAHSATGFYDRALFGELTWHLTHAWQLTGGMRIFSQSFNEDGILEVPKCGLGCGSDALGDNFVENSQRASRPLFKINTSYDFDVGMKAYATFSEGFRRGGATGTPTVGIYASEPQYAQYKPDLSKNYEIGIKGDVDRGRFKYTADVFYIDLQNFQFDSYSPGGNATVYNGSKANSKGAELELSYQLMRGLLASFSYGYTDATVTEATTIYDLPAFGGPGSTPVVSVAIPQGTRLPGVPKNDVNLGLDYLQPVTSDWTVDYHVDGVYRTSAPGSIPTSFLSSWEMSSSKIINADVTLANGRWAFDLYGTNLTSDTAYSGAVGQQGLPLNTFDSRVVTRPRTVGVMIHYDFE